MKSGKIHAARLRHTARRVQGKAAGSARFVHRHVFSTRKRIVSFVFAVLVLPILLVQLFYSQTTLLPNTQVGPIYLGGLSKTEAIKKLDVAYANAKVPIYFSDSKEQVVAPTLSELGVTTTNTSRVNAYEYPFLWRLVPSSLFWYQSLMKKGEPSVAYNDQIFTSYITSRFGEGCRFEPVNGSIVYTDAALRVTEAARGGTCDYNELISKLEKMSPRVTPEKVVVTGSSVAPAISTETAKQELERVTKMLRGKIKLKVENETTELSSDLIAQWVEYSVKGDKLVLGLSQQKADAWLSGQYAARFTIPAGTTTVATYDFQETSRVAGASGRGINTAATTEAIVKRLNGEGKETPQLVVEPIAPKVVYKRSYSSSNEGLSALMKHYADTHPGTYGVKMIELSGARRHAEYNADKQFTTASTYKLFVAYSILLKIERGQLKWDNKSYKDYDISTCFNRMIELSNNECAVDLLNKVGYTGLTNDAKAIGAKSTSFLGRDGIKSNAHDQALLLSMLYTGQILNEQASRDRLINAMKGNIYLRGIPSGLPGVEVANKVGFLDALLHDSAIVYSPKGTYVLVILTENASWGDIAQLTREIEALR